MFSSQKNRTPDQIAEEKLKKAQEAFQNTFQKGEIGEVKEITASSVEDLVAQNIVPSKSEWRRLIDQGAVELNGEKVVNSNAIIPGVYRIGKKTFIKVI
ncbi:hypothetical protein HY310_00140 [Candidatus Microgenomates bacterium]|nr:hypothetical protein [Candidatus Microgenomates bacterium]